MMALGGVGLTITIMSPELRTLLFKLLLVGVGIPVLLIMPGYLLDLPIANLYFSCFYFLVVLFILSGHYNYYYVE